MPFEWTNFRKAVGFRVGVGVRVELVWVEVRVEVDVDDVVRVRARIRGGRVRYVGIGGGETGSMLVLGMLS